MKAYAVTVLVIITATIALCLYVWHDTKKFEESLSPLSERDTVKAAPSTSAVDGVPRQTVAETDPAEPNASEHAHPHPHPHAAPDRHEDIAEMPSEDMSAPVSGADLPQAPETPNQPAKKQNRKIPWGEATVDQQIANLRSWLVKNHDNTAEIDEFLGLTRRVFESPSFVNMSLKDSLRHAELAAKLYPGTGNERRYQSLLEMKASVDNGTFHLYLQRNNIDLENAEIIPIPVNQ